ncbi:lectin C-type domain protein, partial [Ostertagia ostertagi]
MIGIEAFYLSYYFGSPAQMMEFSDAENECRKIGGHLPSVSNAYENSAVQNAAYKILKGPGTGGKVILGYSNLMMNGFTWSDGNPSTYANWAPGRQTGYRYRWCDVDGHPDRAMEYGCT